MITKIQLKKAIEEMGLQGKSLCIHNSLRSFGQPLEQGAETLAEAFLEENCTIIVPTFSHHFEQPPTGTIPMQNGMPKILPESHDRIYSKASCEISTDSMGAFPKYIVEHEGRVRGNHPLNSFTALGPEAESIMKAQTPEDVYGHFRELIQENGQVVMIGTQFTEATILHYSEQLAGRRLFIRWAKLDGKEPVPVRIGSCSRGFHKLGPALEAITKSCKVGESIWKVFPAFEAAENCRKLIQTNPGITHCGNADCERCNDMLRGGPIE